MSAALTQAGGKRRDGGMTMLELMISIAVILIISAVTIPRVIPMLETYRIEGDARTLASQLALARMEASANFTNAEMLVTPASNSYQIELFQNNAWQPQNPTYSLSTGDSFSLNNLPGPAGTQSALQQSTTIIFDSRGIVVDNNGIPTGNDAVYLAGANGESYAVTVDAGGKATIWKLSAGTWTNLD